MVFVLEERQRGVPALELDEPRREEHARDVKAKREREQGLQLVSEPGKAGVKAKSRALRRQGGGMHVRTLHVGWGLPLVVRAARIPVTGASRIPVIVPSPMNRCSAPPRSNVAAACCAAAIAAARSERADSAESQANSPAAMRSSATPEGSCRTRNRSGPTSKSTRISPSWPGWFTCQMRSSGKGDSINRHDPSILRRSEGNSSPGYAASALSTDSGSVFESAARFASSIAHSRRATSGR